MSNIENIILDSLDGFEFQNLCARIFAKIGFYDIQVLTTNDKGRDIIMKLNGKKIIVECKHQPSSSIGRPIIQKLHSAVISENASKGIVITTGKFSQEAIEHAMELSKRTEIELIDLPKLTALATKASIRISLYGNTLQIFSFPVSEKNVLAAKISNSLSKIQSSPYKINNILEVIPNLLDLKAAYLVKYDISQQFSTSVGMIHSIDEKNQFILLDAETGQKLDDDIEQFFVNANLINERDIPKSYRSNRTSFKHDLVTIKVQSTNHIIKRHTKPVSYLGNNNQSYSKLCEPGPRSVFITDVKQVYVPINSVLLKILKHQYHCKFVENNNNVLIKSTNLFTCGICKSVLTEGLLCNACGNLAHLPKWRDSHGFNCKNCNKTICKLCAFYTHHLLFLKKILCEGCATTLSRKNKKVYRLS